MRRGSGGEIVVQEIVREGGSGGGGAVTYPPLIKTHSTTRSRRPCLRAECSRSDGPTRAALRRCLLDERRRGARLAVGGVRHGMVRWLRPWCGRWCVRPRVAAPAYPFPMLTRINYNTWALVMEVNLQAAGLWEAIDDDAVPRRKDRQSLAAVCRPTGVCHRNGRRVSPAEKELGVCRRGRR